MEFTSLMQTAVGHQRAGRFQDAVVLYEQVLAAQPDQPDALHLLGLALNRLGFPAEALEHVQRAVELMPAHPGFQFSLANLLRASGRLAEAERAFRAVVAAEPADLAARNGLAVVLLELDRSAEAIVELEAALARDPGFVPALDNLAATLLKQKTPEASARAEALARRALAIAPDGAESLNNLGGALLQLERNEEAEAPLRRATQVRPDLPSAWFNLGVAAKRGHKLLLADSALRRALKLVPDDVAYLLAASEVSASLSLTQESLVLAQRAFELDPDSLEVLLALASAWRDQNEHAESQRLLRMVIARAPAANLYATLGHSLLESGDHEAAQAVLQQALALDPDNCPARLTLANIARVKSLDEPNVQELLRLAAKADLREDNRMSACYALGKCHDDVGDHATAFRYYKEANEIKKTTLADYTPDRQRAKLAACKRVFSRERVSAAQHRGSQSELPVFVVGMPRSGTSLAEQIIASHPLAHGAGELNVMREIVARIGAASVDRGGPDFPEALFSMRPEEMEAATKRYLDRLTRGVEPGKTRIVDKMPLNLKNLGVIAMLFPKARIVHCMRNPVDNCLSIYFQNFGRGNIFANDLEDLGDYYAEVDRLARLWKETLPIPIFELPYEQVVEDPETWARKLIDSIGLDWDPRCLEFHKTERAVRTASAWQVKQPIYKRSVARWKRYGDALEPLLATLRAEGIAFE